jgi:hypothetical protein
MKSPHHFIIKPYNERRYDNVRKYGDVDFIISSSQEDHTASNRMATVVSVPISYDGPIKSGYEVIVHHNVFKFYYDMKGNQKSSWHHLFDDYFIIENDQLFLYREKDGEWNATYPYCFVRPIPNEDKIISTTGSREELWGELVYFNEQLQDVSKGDIVSFSPDSEYEFRIEGDLLYRMYNKNICLKR